MKTFAIVVAADEKRGIGRDGNLPWPTLRKDLATFRRITTGNGSNAVIMGRRTWHSIPDAYRPLRGRRNVVISRADMDGAERAASLDDALALCANAHERFVIGGGQLYETALAHVALTHLFYTRVHGEFACDTFFPPFEHDFALESASPREQDGDAAITFEVWRRLVR